MNSSTIFSSRDMLSAKEALGLEIPSIVVLLANVFLSSLTMIIIVVTNQLKTTSNRVMFYLNLSDLATACYRLLTLLLIFDHKKRFFNTTFEIAVQFVACQVAYFSAYVVVILAFDRYLHVKHLKNVAQIFTKRKVDWLTALALMLSTLFASSLTMEALNMQHGGALRLTRYIINITLMLLAIILYVMTMREMKKHSNKAVHKTSLEKLNKTVAMASSACLFSIALFYTPICAMLTVRAVLQKSKWKEYHLELYLHIAMIFAQLNTVFNATMYLTVNRKAKKAILAFFNRRHATIN
jgi:7 transmembrane receptor (rhodopsin family).